MPRFWISVLAVVALSVASAEEFPTALSGDRLDTVLEEIERNLGELTVLQVDFVQEKHLAMFGQALKASGVIYFRAPDNIRFELVKPFASVLIVRGDKVAKYEQIGSGWQRLNLGNPDALTMVMNQIAAWMQGRFREQSRVFEIRAELRPELVLILAPRPAPFRKIIERIELSFNAAKDSLQSLSIYQPDGDSTILLFSGERRNKALSETLFELGAVPQFPDAAK